MSEDFSEERKQWEPVVRVPILREGGYLVAGKPQMVYPFGIVPIITNYLEYVQPK